MKKTIAFLLLLMSNASMPLLITSVTAQFVNYPTTTQSAYSGVLGNDKATAKAYYKKGQSFFKSGAYQQAVATWQLATKTGILSGSQYTNMITQLANLGDYTSALAFSKDFVAAYPTQALPYALQVKTAQLADADTSKGLAIEPIEAHNRILLSKKGGAETNKQTLTANYTYLLNYYAHKEKNLAKASAAAATLSALYPQKSKDAISKLGARAPLPGTYYNATTQTSPTVTTPASNLVVVKDTVTTMLAKAPATATNSMTDLLLSKGASCFLEAQYNCALQNWEAAEKMGSGAAAKHLGVLYEKGLGVPVDYSKAMEYYQSAAQKSVPEANGLVGSLYEQGLGIEKNYPKALEWYNKGKESGDTLMNKRIAQVKAKIDAQTATPVVTPPPATTQPATVRGRGTGIKPAETVFAADKGNTGTYTNTEIVAAKTNASAEELYNKGFDFYKAGNLNEARYHWEKAAAAAGNPSAKYKSMNELGKLYMEGQGVEQDYTKALQYFEKAAANGLPYGSPDAAKAVGTLYENGFGVDPNDAKALEWYRRAQRMGNKYVSDDVKRIAGRLKRG